MIAQITGEIVESTMTTAVVDVNGVGYLLSLPLSTAEQLPPPKSKVTLYTYLAVREDAMQLYGFLTRPEKELFQLVVDNVKGFGPRLALNVISAMSISAFCNAIATHDVKLLGKINGVGKKSAEQLVLDLSGKLGGIGGVTPTGTATQKTAANQMTPAAQDAVAALETLGFKRDDALHAINTILAEEADSASMPTATLIRKALAKISASR